MWNFFSQNIKNICDIKDAFQIVFFIVVGAVTVLSYLSARKTIFASINTEIFKLQLAVFKDILLFFQRTSFENFDNKFDIENIFKINLMTLMDAYIKENFSASIGINEENRKGLKQNVCGSLMTFSYMEKNNWKFTQPFSSSNKINPGFNENSKTKWDNYEYGEILYTRKYLESIQKIDLFIGSPLIPSPLRDSLSRFKDSAMESLVWIGYILTEFSKELPANFRTPEDLEKFDGSGVWNLYLHNWKKKINLDKEAEALMRDINEYLNIEKLIEHKLGSRGKKERWVPFKRNDRE